MSGIGDDVVFLLDARRPDGHQHVAVFRCGGDIGRQPHIEIACAHRIEIHEQLVHLADLRAVHGIHAPAAHVGKALSDLEIIHLAEGRDAHPSPAS